MTTRAGRALRGTSGLLAGGLVALAIGMAVAWYVAGSVAPGTGRVLTHVAAAVIAVAAQLYADRHRDGRGAPAAYTVIAIAAAVLGLAWIA